MAKEIETYKYRYLGFIRGSKVQILYRQVVIVERVVVANLYAIFCCMIYFGKMLS
jgi:hypothetical protein